MERYTAMVQMLGQVMMMPVSMATCWMNVLSSAMGCMQSPAWQGQDASNRYGNAPGAGFPETGSHTDNPPWAQRDGANKQAKEERNMSDCGCDHCDHEHHREVKLVEYSIVSIKRCHERIITKGEVIYSDDMSDESFATWVIALYLQDPKSEPIHHDDKKYLRVYHHVLESWPRPDKDCCDDRQVDVLRGIEQALRDLGSRRGEALAS